MIRKHIKIAVDLPTTDPTNKLMLEPGTKDVIIISDGGLKVGVNKKDLLDAIAELDAMKLAHLPPENEEVKEEPAIGEMIEGDEE